MTQLVITGLGVVSPFGAGVEVLWEALLAGETAIRTLSLFDTGVHRTSIAAQVPGVRAGLIRRSSKGGHLDRVTRTDQFALTAAREAMGTAKLLPGSSEMARAGLFFGSSTGGMLEAESIVMAAGLGHGKYSHVGGQAECAPANALAREVGIGGPAETIASACSASTMAFEAAFMSLTSGEVSLALVGGSDGLCELTYAGFNSLRAVDSCPARPFRQDREGLSIGEGSGVLVIESLEHALDRGVEPLAVLAGTGTSCDAHHMTAPHPEGRGAWRAMTQALGAQVGASSTVDFVNTHGTGTPHNDLSEGRALKRLLGDRLAQVPVTATKGSVGHLLGACGALEAVVTVLCLQHRRLPPVPGAGPLDPEVEIDLCLGQPRELTSCRSALSVNLAFGGANAAIHLGRYEGKSE